MNRAVHFFGVVGISCFASFAWGLPTAYDGFDYANDGSPLAGQDGGYGWSGPWTELGAGPGDDFTLTQAETSLDLPMLPFEPSGDSVIAVGPGSGGNNNFARRPLSGGFDLGADGTLYASFLMQKNGSESSASDNQELNLMSGGSQALRLGSTSGDQWWLGVSSNTFQGITFGETYFAVVKIDAMAAGDDMASIVVFDATEAVPGADPGAYDATYSFGSGATINGAQFWIGTNASGAFDELRLGSTWEDVTSVDPSFILGDFNMVDDITPADFQILSNNLFTGTTYEQGDIDFSGLVDLTDFALFREIYLNQGGSLSDLTAVPEPSTGVLVILANVLLFALGRRRLAYARSRASR
jgi:hypothetical protein